MEDVVKLKSEVDALKTVVCCLISLMKNSMSLEEYKSLLDLLN